MSSNRSNKTCQGQSCSVQVWEWWIGWMYLFLFCTVSFSLHSPSFICSLIYLFINFFRFCLLCVLFLSLVSYPPVLSASGFSFHSTRFIVLICLFSLSSLAHHSPSQVYRFITRDTYEMEMFLRAHKKLVFDNAVMGTMTITVNAERAGQAEVYWGRGSQSWCFALAVIASSPLSLHSILFCIR